ncbi:MAG: amidase [Promethearchaeota archaeon]|nr:MAG: amidase [Candidatus Lokiarchaeota archaeon]
MKENDICFMPACDMAEKIRTQELTSAEITEVIIERIEKINPIVNAYCTPTFDLAREMAKTSDDKVKKGKKIGPLEGIPISIKDLMYTEGIRTTFGSLIYENFIPEEDGVAVARLKSAGCVILGKTNTPEFGYAGVTHNKVFGVSKNPWNLNRTPGGSSGGAAAAVASGMSPLALGSDGGGSIRHPACFCGVYGLKPSLGRVPVYPKKGIKSPHTQYGPIVRYVKDAALMLDVMKGPHDADKYSLPDDKKSYLEEINIKPKRLEIGFSLDLGYAKVVDEDVKNAVKKAVYNFEKVGWVINIVKEKLKPPRMAFNTLYTAMFAHDLKPQLKKWRDKIDPDLLKLVDAGLTYPGTAITKALHQRQKYYEIFYPFFKKYDILITPTTAIPAFELGMMFPPKINGIGVSPTGWQPFTFPFNLTGFPAATIPCGWSREGVPIGMQIVGKRFDDLLVLQVSKVFEEIAPWQDKRPKFN